MRGDADLEDCNTILTLGLDEETLKEFGTISGYLCMISGEIPNVHDFVMSMGWCFEVTAADEKRILGVTVSSLLGSEVDNRHSDDDKDDSIDRSDSGSNNNFDDMNDVMLADKQFDENFFDGDECLSLLPDMTCLEEAHRPIDAATQIDRMVKNNEAKRIFVKEMKEILAKSEFEEQLKS